MTVTTWLELALASALLLSGVLGIWLLRERAGRRAAERETKALRLERDQEQAGLRILLQESRQRESRQLALIGVLWKELEGLCHTALELKERYKREKDERARQAVWLEHYPWEISELEGLLSRILARWAADKRAHASESLIKELLGAILHFFGGKSPAT